VRLACSHTPPASAGQFPTDEGIKLNRVCGGTPQPKPTVRLSYKEIEEVISSKSIIIGGLLMNALKTVGIDG